MFSRSSVPEPAVEEKKIWNNECITGKYILPFSCEETRVKHFWNFQEIVLNFLSFLCLKEKEEKIQSHSNKVWLEEDLSSLWWISLSPPSCSRLACRHRQQHNSNVRPNYQHFSLSVLLRHYGSSDSQSKGLIVLLSKHLPKLLIGWYFEMHEETGTVDLLLTTKMSHKAVIAFTMLRQLVCSQQMILDCMLCLCPCFWLGQTFRHECVLTGRKPGSLKCK